MNLIEKIIKQHPYLISTNSYCLVLVKNKESQKFECAVRFLGGSQPFGLFPQPFKNTLAECLNGLRISDKQELLDYTNEEKCLVEFCDKHKIFALSIYINNYNNSHDSYNELRITINKKQKYNFKTLYEFFDFYNNK